MISYLRIAIIYCRICLFALPANGQTHISGVVNTYTQVTEVLPAKACMRVSSTAGLSVFSWIMIYQSRGADINTANSNAFGAVTAYNEAGKYEINYICHITGDSVFFTHNFVNNYAAGGMVQLVGMPVYDQALVTDTLKAGPYNSSTGTGGIIAIRVEDALTLNAPIYADSSGFRGGAFKLLNGAYTLCAINTYNSYSYNTYTANESAAFKGDGIWVPVSTGYSGGRGAPANGGGGGGDHNNGGGGGGNLGTGGKGGDNTSTTGCRGRVPGIGAYALNSNGGTRLFMGGGGGAGHANGVSQSWGGGNGGGIIYIQANNIIGNNFTISANGASGAPGQGDGAGGGGAGGTIILRSNNYTGAVLVSASGGKGGNADNISSPNRCYGPGGGGSGGVIYFSGTLPAISTQTNGGNNGAAINSIPVTCDGAAGSASGAAGTVITGYTTVNATAPSGYCAAIALPLQIIDFYGERKDNDWLLHFSIGGEREAKNYLLEHSADGVRWQTIYTALPGPGSYTFLHRTNGHEQTHFYRLMVITRGNSRIFSKVLHLQAAAKYSKTKIYPNPAGGQITLSGLSGGMQHIRLFHPDGRLAWQHNLPVSGSSHTIHLPSFHPGIYILQVNGEALRLIIR